MRIAYCSIVSARCEAESSRAEVREDFRNGGGFALLGAGHEIRGRVFGHGEK
jgi:hypothetical protein